MTPQPVAKFDPHANIRLTAKTVNLIYKAIGVTDVHAVDGELAAPHWAYIHAVLEERYGQENS